MRAGHFVESVDDRFKAARVFDLTEFPERRPKRRDVVNGPLVELVKGTEFSSFLLVNEADEARQVRVFDPFVRWFPERLFHGSAMGTVRGPAALHSRLPLASRYVQCFKLVACIS